MRWRTEWAWHLAYFSSIHKLLDRADKAAQQVRVIGEQPGAVDARAAGSRRGGAKPGTPAPGQLRPLDRSIEPVREPGNRNRDKEQKGQNDAQQQQQASEKQQAERKRQIETQQQEQQQRQREVQQQQPASEKQQAERKPQAQTQQERQAECERLAVLKHQDPSQCKIETLPKESPGNPNRVKNGNK